MHDVRQALDLALTVRECKLFGPYFLAYAVPGLVLEFRTRAGQTPFLERIRDQGRYWHGTFPGFRLRPADRVEPIGALVDADFALVEVDISPPQAAQFGRPQAGEDRGQDDRPPFALQSAYNGLDLRRERNVYPKLEFPLLASFQSSFLAF